MTTEIFLPSLGESVTEGTITRWLKSPGDQVAVDEPLLEVSTDKVDTEIPSPVAGTLLEIRAQEDDAVGVGSVLAVVGDQQASDVAGTAASAGTDAAQGSDAADATADDALPPAPTPQPATAAVPAHSTPGTTSDPAPAEVEVPLPPLGESVAEGTITRWLKSPGEKVAADEPLLEVSTDKVDTEIPSPVAGTLLRILAEEDEQVAVGATVALIGPTPQPPAMTQPPTRSAHTPAAGGSTVAPLPTGPTTSMAAAPTPDAEELRGRTTKISRLRKIIARRMTESLQVAAQLTQVVEIDVTAVGRLREAHKASFLQREGVKLTYLSFFVKASAEVLQRHPSLNASLDQDAGAITFYDHEHIALAVDTPKGLYTPVLRNVGTLSITEIAHLIADVAQRTRTNAVTPDELTGGTFTITNIGSFGALFDTPIINQPQVAILGPGAVVKRPVVMSDPNLGETIAIRSMAYFSLTYDHRVVDGADAGRFLADLRRTLEGAQFEV